MNLFVNLDNYFPTGRDRKFGEVVQIYLRTLYDNQEIGSLRWKRKQWYVNASVNAWHMHRGLCQDFRVLVNENGYRDAIPHGVMKAIRRELAAQVMQAYLINYQTDEQYFDVELRLMSPKERSRFLKWDLNPRAIDSWGIFWTDPEQLETILLSDMTRLEKRDVEFLRARHGAYLDNHGAPSGFPGALW